MSKIQLWMEGAHHPFDELCDWYREFFHRHGHTVETGSLNELLEKPRPDLYVLGGLTFSGHPETYKPVDEGAFQTLRQNLREGSRLLGLHCVLGSFDKHGDQIKDLFDGLWVWDRSEHSPVEEFDVLTTETIALTEGVPKTFRIKDELYYNLDYPQRSEVFLKAQYKDDFWPLAWHGETEGSPMVYLGLGHDLDSTNNPAFKTLLGNALRQLVGQ